MMIFSKSHHCHMIIAKHITMEQHPPHQTLVPFPWIQLKSFINFWKEKGDVKFVQISPKVSPIHVLFYYQLIH